uniref:Tetraspanin n=1 Tax=Schistocephalus solidus TaxID=70667 RepID=A0A0X3Q5F2_SCHSO
MCCAIAALLKFVISTVNVVLGIGFLIVALLGVLLKSSAPFVRSILTKALSFGGKIEDEKIKYLTDFVLENSTGVSVILIVVGLALAILCFIGAFASCCACEILLKIYAIILAILLVAQIIAVSVLFSNPVKLTQSIDLAMTKMLEYFNKGDKLGSAATTIWMFTMTFNGTCCGMDGAADFQKNLKDSKCPSTLLRKRKTPVYLR